MREIKGSKWPADLAALDSLPKRVRFLRLQQVPHMPQVELSALIGKSKNYINSLETGGRKTPEPVVRRIASELQVSFIALIDGLDSRDCFTGTIEHIIGPHSRNEVEQSPPIGETLRRLRYFHNIPMEQIAHDTGIPIKVLESYELVGRSRSVTHHPTQVRLEALAKVYGITPRSILDGEAYQAASAWRNLPTLGRRVKYLRCVHQVKQVNITRTLKRTYSYIHRLEADEIYPDLLTLNRLAPLLGTSSKELTFNLKLSPGARGAKRGQHLFRELADLSCLGEVLKNHRKSRGWTIVLLSQRANVSESTLRKCEAIGRNHTSTVPMYSTLEKIAEALGTRANSLIQEAIDLKNASISSP